MTKLALDSTLKLNDGKLIPRLGLGVYLTMGSDAIAAALKKTGYRHVDTAQFYHNEKEVGQAFRASGLKRDEVWITTKVRFSATVDELRASHTSSTDLGHEPRLRSDPLKLERVLEESKLGLLRLRADPLAQSR